ncbi:hypothetical protein EPN28_00690 [Patescibacteria group bacterium]|nr:MAG: hypothetical protein EPN28_00690 [Patescibacteria group bacterium]
MKKVLYTLVVILLGGAVVMLGVGYLQLRQDLAGAQSLLEAKKRDDKSLLFLQMFIKQVIKSKTEVSFDTRLKLENAVRELNDAVILAQWKKFVDSTSEVEAQANVKDLLDMLVDKIILGGKR